VTETQYYTPTNSNSSPDPYVRPGGYPPGPHGELGDVLRTLLRSWWIIGLCGIIALGVGLGITSRTANTYQGTAYVLLNNSGFQQAITGSAPQVNTQTVEATAVDMLTPQRQAQAAQAAGLRPNENYSVSINASPNSNVLHVNGTAATPREAAALADAAAAQLLAAVRQANATSLTGARAAVHAQLAAAKRSQKQALASQLNSLTTLEALSDQSVEVIQHALVPAVASGPSKARNGAIALVLGLILGCAIALLRPRRERLPRP
jgi:uncharacterized protein involved in exopolysaccharide biosynthesis